uniref:Uncharacterized protein n=1 Tax=Romanomermis culicivorax TaxID=13658 RepID=A0A915IUU1_ROMCU
MQYNNDEPIVTKLRSKKLISCANIEIPEKFSALGAEQSQQPKIYLRNQNFSSSCTLQAGLCKKCSQIWTIHIAQ